MVQVEDGLTHEICRRVFFNHTVRHISGMRSTISPNV